MRSTVHSRLLLAALLLASCRSILDIHPGKLDETAANEGGDTAMGSTTSTGGSAKPNGGNGSGGATAGGKAGASNNGGKAGSSAQAGSAPEAGAPGSDAGADAGGAGNTPVALFPAGFCADCIARNCSAEEQACQEAGCQQQVGDWLACHDDDATMCLLAGVDGVVMCASHSCDACRHIDDAKPSVEILTPSNGAQITPDANGLIEVAVRVHNFSVKTLGTCGADMNCGHVHLNIGPDASCKISPFYNAVVFAVAADGTADTTINTSAQACKDAINGKVVSITASLSAYQAHQDRVPLVQSRVDVSIVP